MQDIGQNTGQTQTGQMGQTVTILLATYNGAQHLSAQLDSIAAQTFKNWRILASDDGSDDATLEILNDFARHHPLTCLTGPGQGLVRNFMHLLGTLDTGPDALPTAVAFCDQDDIWLPDKLSVALEALTQVFSYQPDHSAAGQPAVQPALYCSGRTVWDPQHDSRQPSVVYQRPPSFANACIENIAPGNTIVLNPAAAALACKLAPTAQDVFVHDWWLYLLITGVGGHIVYDPEPQLLYRQHAGNVLGAGEQLSRKVRNKAAVLRGAFADRIGRNIAAMQAVAPYLTPDNQRCLSLFARARQTGLPRRLALLRQAGVYRQGFLSGLTFWGAVCLGKV